MHRNLKAMFRGAALAASLAFSALASAELNEGLWPLLHESFFAGKPIEAAPFIKLEGPGGAENGAQVPITLTIERSPSAPDAITKVTLLVDANPIPLAAVYRFTPLSGKAQISTRIRLETDSYVRAIGETADGKLFMSAIIIHAGGGCAGTVGGDENAIRATAGKIKLNAVPPVRLGEPNAAVFMIKHPMYTGLQRDTATGKNKPAFYISKANFSFNGRLVLQADWGVGTAEDPYLRFFYLPEKSGKLEVQADDSEGRTFTGSVDIAPL